MSIVPRIGSLLLSFDIYTGRIVRESLVPNIPATGIDKSKFKNAPAGDGCLKRIVANQRDVRWGHIVKFYRGSCIDDIKLRIEGAGCVYGHGHRRIRC